MLRIASAANARLRQRDPFVENMPFPWREALLPCLPAAVLVRPDPVARAPRGGMRFQAINPGPSLSRDAIEAYERANMLALPEPLKQQLLEQNGGAPVAEVRVGVAGREEELMSFFGIDTSDPSSELAWVARTYDGRL